MDNHGVARSARRVLTEAEKKKEVKRIEEYRSLVKQVLQRYREKDYTSEALTMTSALLNQNLEFYTIWNYRRMILKDVLDKELAADSAESAGDGEATSGIVSPAQTEISLLIREDLQFLLPLQRINPKVYWLWNHRSWLLAQASKHLPIQTALAFWQEELGLVSKMLSRDDRNFHGWGYRREVITNMERLRLREMQEDAGNAGRDQKVLVAQASLAQQEFEYADKMARSNFSNFSAWHHRMQQLHKLLDSESADDARRRIIFNRELGLASELLWAATDSKDQSLWFYHSDLLNSLDPDAEQRLKIIHKVSAEDRRAIIEAQMEIVKEILEDNEDCKWIYQSLVHLADMYAKAGGQADVQCINQWLDNLERLDPSRRLRWQELRKRHDR